MVRHVYIIIYIQQYTYAIIYMYIHDTIDIYIHICKHVFFLSKFSLKSRKITVTCFDAFSYFLCSQNIMKQPPQQQRHPCAPMSWQTFIIFPPFGGKSPFLGSVCFLWFKEIVVQNSEQVLVASIQVATRGQHLRDQGRAPLRIIFNLLWHNLFLIGG